MKKHFRIITVFIALALLVSIHTVSLAQLPPPPPPNGGPGGGHGLGGNQGPAGAPIGNGTYILFALAAAYALRKVYVSRKVTAEE
jgi:hypothetical protein